MIAVTVFAGKKVAVFGLGGSGLTSASALLAGGADVIGWDDNADSVVKATSAGIPTADLRQLDWSRIAALVLAPGVPLTHPKPHWTVNLADAAGVPIIGDVELFVRERGARAPDSAGGSDCMISQVAKNATANSMRSRERPERPSDVRLVTL